MSRFVLRIALALLCAALACGCRSSSVAPPVPLDALLSEYAVAECARAVECCTAAELVDIYDVTLPTARECQDAILQGGAGQAELLALGAMLEADGQVVYDDGKAGAFLSDLRNATCARFATMDRARRLADVFAGNLSLGEACDASLACESGWCDGSVGHGAFCTELPGEGAPCTFVCAPELVCVDGGAGGTTCQPLLSDGTICALDYECASGACNDVNPMTSQGSCGEPEISLRCDGT